MTKTLHTKILTRISDQEPINKRQIWLYNSFLASITIFLVFVAAVVVTFVAWDYLTLSQYTVFGDGYINIIDLSWYEILLPALLLGTMVYFIVRANLETTVVRYRLALFSGIFGVIVFTSFGMTYLVTHNTTVSGLFTPIQQQLDLYSYRKGRLNTLSSTLATQHVHFGRIQSMEPIGVTNLSTMEIKDRVGVVRQFIIQNDLTDELQVGDLVAIKTNLDSTQILRIQRVMMGS
jgi:hypothetical protein